MARSGDKNIPVGLVKNIAHLTTSGGESPEDVQSHCVEAAGQILLKGLTLGYSLTLVGGLMKALIRHDVQSGSELCSITGLMRALPSHGKRQLLEQTLKWSSETLSPRSGSILASVDGDRKGVSAGTLLVSAVVNGEETVKQHLLDFLADPARTSSISLKIRRAAIATLSIVASDELPTFLEKMMASFGDQLFIKHAPILQQEDLAQTLLLASGYLHRQSPMAVLLAARSSGHMQGVSNRLDTTGQRARWLGMVVGTALSQSS